MSEPTPQTYANHKRLDPPYHVWLFGALTLCFLYAVFLLVTHPAVPHVFLVVFMAAQILMALKVRTYALKVQDRVIRLEERLRLASLLPEPLKGRIGEISASQLTALRFAADAELPSLVTAALDEKLANDAIKRRITSWRADTFRV